MTRTKIKDGIIMFGKYSGQTLREVHAGNPKYLTWMLDTIDLSADEASMVQEVVKPSMTEGKTTSDSGASSIEATRYNNVEEFNLLLLQRTTEILVDGAVHAVSEDTRAFLAGKHENAHTKAIVDKAREAVGKLGETLKKRKPKKEKESKKPIFPQRSPPPSESDDDDIPF